MFGVVHSQFRTPHAAFLVSAVVMVGLTLSGSFVLSAWLLSNGARSDAWTKVIAGVEGLPLFLVFRARRRRQVIPAEALTAGAGA